MKRKLNKVFFSLLLVNNFIFGQDFLQSIFSEIQQGNIQILGGTQNRCINFIDIALETPLGDNVIIIFNKKFEVLNYYLGRMRKSWFPVSINDKYIAFGIGKKNESGNWLIIYDIENNTFLEFNPGYHMIWNIYLFNDTLFFSSEKGNPHLNLIDLKTKEIKTFSNYYCPSCIFGEKENELYAYCKENNKLFKYDKGNFISDTSTNYDEINFVSKDISDFSIDESIINLFSTTETCFIESSIVSTENSFVPIE